MYKIVICGSQKAGKGEAKAFFLELFEEHKMDNIFTLKFAEPMKNYNEWLGYDDECDISVTKNRSFYQELSDLTKAHYGDEVFVDVFKASHLSIEEDFDDVDVIIVDDCRYPRELDVCKSLGYYSIFVDCPEEVRKKRAEADGTDFITNHNSEQFVPQLESRCNFIVTNDTDDLFDLKRQVEFIFNEILGKGNYAA